MSKNYITVLTTHDSTTVKQYNQTESGIEKIGAPNCHRFIAQSVHCPDLKRLKSIINDVNQTHNQVLILGSIPSTHDGKEYAIVSLSELEEICASKGQKYSGRGGIMDGHRFVTCRSKLNFEPSQFIVFDKDSPKGMPADLDVQDWQEWWNKITNALPQLQSVAFLKSDSSSSLVRSECGTYSATTNMNVHIYVEIANVDDYSRFASVIMAHSLITGIARYVVDEKNNKRTFFGMADITSFSQERLVYEGKPITNSEKITMVKNELVLTRGLKLVTSSFELLDNASMEKLNLSSEMTRSGGFRNSDHNELEMNTKIFFQKEQSNGLKVMTFSEFLQTENGINCVKTRCNTPFRRDSESMAAYVQFTKDKQAFIYDCGSMLNYYPKKDVDDLFSTVKTPVAPSYTIPALPVQAYTIPPLPALPVQAYTIPPLPPAYTIPALPVQKKNESIVDDKNALSELIQDKLRTLRAYSPEDDRIDDLTKAILFDIFELELMPSTVPMVIKFKNRLADELISITKTDFKKIVLEYRIEWQDIRSNNDSDGLILNFPDIKLNAMTGAVSPKKTMGNMRALLLFKGVIAWHDMYSNRLVVEGRYAEDSGSLDKLKAHMISDCNEHGLDDRAVKDYMPVILGENIKNVVLEYLVSNSMNLKVGYDPIAVVAKALSSGKPDEDGEGGADDYEWNYAALKLWLIQCCQAADNNQPVKVAIDKILMLFGDQGLGKTRFIKALVPPQLNEYSLTGHLLNVNDKDSKTIALSNWIVELGEIDATFKRSDIASLKAFLSNTTDTIRKVYATDETTSARMTSFAGSVNVKNCLRDETGNRRFLPITVTTEIILPESFSYDDLWAYVWKLHEAMQDSDEGNYWLVGSDESIMQNRILKKYQYDKDGNHLTYLLGVFDFSQSLVEYKWYSSVQVCEYINNKCTLGSKIITPDTLKTIISKLELPSGGKVLTKNDNGIQCYHLPHMSMECIN